MDSTKPLERITATMPAAAARLAAEELFRATRQAKADGDLSLALHLESAGNALHRAGWAHLAPEAREERRNRALVERGPA